MFSVARIRTSVSSFPLWLVIAALTLSTWSDVHAADPPTARAMLTLSSEPPGAAVYIDSALVGRTPLTLNDVAAGAHRVRMTRDGYLENSRVVNVPAGSAQTLQVRLTSRNANQVAPPVSRLPLKIVIIEGEAGVNIIQQKTAVRTVVEVRDRNDTPVSGAIVVFNVGSSGTASVGSGASTATLITDAAGRVSIAVNPLKNGAVRIQVTASANGQTGATVVTQNNVANAAQAAQAANAVAASAAAGGAAGAGGGGFSALALTGIIAGGAATAGVVVLATRNSQPTLTTITATPAIGFVGVNSTIDFLSNASDSDEGDTLTFAWDFGDGTTGTGQPATHTYTRAGNFIVRLTVSDGRADVIQEQTIPVKELTGNWRSDPLTTVAGTLNMNFALTVSGSTITGSFAQGAGAGPITGTLRATAPQVTFSVAVVLNGQSFPPFVFSGTLDATFDSIAGTFTGSGFVNTPVSIVRQ